MKLKLWLQKLQKSSWIFIVALAVGVLLRIWFVFFKDLNIDQATTLGFIQHDWWGSIWWDNSPPLLYILGKTIKQLCGADLQSTLVVLKIIIFTLSTISLYLTVNLIRSKWPTEWLWIFGLCVFPVALVDTTVIRPTFLTEFFAIVNFVIFLRICNNQRRIGYLVVFAISSFGLLASSYLGALYFAGLLFYYLYLNQFKILKPSEFLQKNNRYTAIVFANAFVSLVVGVILFFEIRWENLSWIGGDTKIIDSIISSFFWARNLMGYNWLALVFFVFGVAYTRRWILFLPIVFLLFINLFTGRVAEEPRFVIFFWPLFFYWIIELDLALPRVKWYVFFKYLVVLVWVWQTAWFFKEPRSSLSLAQAYIQESQVDSVVVEISRSALDYAFQGLPQLSWEELKQKACPHKSALVSPQHRPQYDREKHFQVAKEFGFTVDSEKVFLSKLESIEVLIFKRSCPP